MQKELFDSGEILPYRHALLLDERGCLVFECSCPVRFGRETGVTKEIPNGKKESIVVWEIGTHGLELISMIGMRREYPYKDYPTFPGNRLLGARLRTLWPHLVEKIVGIARERMRRWKKEPRRVTMYFPRWRRSGLVWEKETPRRRGITFSVSLRDRALLLQILLADLGRRRASEWFVSRDVNRKLWAYSDGMREAARDPTISWPTDFGEAREIREWYESGRVTDHFLAWLVARGLIGGKYLPVLSAILETSSTGSAERFERFVDLFCECLEYQGETLPFHGADLYPRPFTRKDQQHLSFEVIPWENRFMPAT